MKKGVLLLTLLLCAPLEASIDTTNPTTGKAWTLWDVCQECRQPRLEFYDPCRESHFCANNSSSLGSCMNCALTCYYRSTSRKVYLQQQFSCYDHFTDWMQASLEVPCP